MFIDEAKIRVKAGDGGNGCMAFRREKFVPRGGPSGGDGGRGGDVVMVSSQRHNTLIHFRYNPEHKAQRGEHGMGSNCSGLDGNSIFLQVPVGTSLYDQETGELIHDFEEPDEQVIIAKGGRGGRGNQHFATSVHQAPREHELGRPGEERLYRLELKLLADVGLVGYPNAGKSTLISRISAARPKIADYPFTTLEPNLGVVTIGEEPDLESFVVADMPGLIEGAHLGSGLGTQFLRHIERTRLLLHLVDVSDASGRLDPVEDFKVINKELASFTSSPTRSDSDPFADDADTPSAPGHPLANKEMIVIATKIDSANPEKLKKLAAHVKRRKLEFYAISAVTGQGIDELKWAVAKKLRTTS
jgi:GTP-binding protein